MNRCHQAGRLFGAYWDDEVTQAEREWLESHLAGCTRCRLHYEQFARTLESVGSLPRTEVTSDLPERALVAARRATAVPDRIAVAPSRPRWVPITAVAALMLVGATTLLTTLAPLSSIRMWGAQGSRGLIGPRDGLVAEPRLVATALSGSRVSSPLVPARGAATLADSLFDHSADVEFILDPVILHRGRAQAASRLPAGAQGEQTVISF